MDMAVSLARKKGIIVNTNLKKQSIHSDWAVFIKKIPMDTPKKMIIAAVFEFGDIKSIKVQLIGMWQKTVVKFVNSDQTEQLASKWSFLIEKNSVHMAMAVEDCETWASRDCFRALLFTLPVGTMAHNLGTFLERAGEKTCVINCSVNTGNRVCCAVIGFESEEDLESAYHIELIFGSAKLFWARMDLVWCEHCGKFGHSVLECDATITSTSKPFKLFKKSASKENCLCLARLYTKKNILISHPTAFGGRFWAQVVLAMSISHNHSTGTGSGLFPIVGTDSNGKCSSLTSMDFFWMHVLDIVKQLNGVELPSIPVLSAVVDSSMDLNMVLDVPNTCSVLPSPVTDDASIFSSSSLKVLTSKVGSLKSKLVALKASVGSVLVNNLVWKVAMCNIRGINIPTKQKDIMHWHKKSGNMVLFITKTKLKPNIRPWIINKFERVRIFSSGLDKSFLRAGVVIIINYSLVCHVSKVEKLLFKGKLSVIFLGLYAGISAGIRFGLASNINFFIAKVVNLSSFVVLDKNFDENGSKKSASYKFCLDIGLVNSFYEHSLVKTPT
ncbi:hypothetical protein G9A89_017148 [Geosiphon pyriformis]|nr:hypothetical protein G9A89_017148 [Geosiphon pyriformis]